MRLSVCLSVCLCAICVCVYLQARRKLLSCGSLAVQKNRHPSLDFFSHSFFPPFFLSFLLSLFYFFLKGLYPKRLLFHIISPDQDFFFTSVISHLFSPWYDLRGRLGDKNQCSTYQSHLLNWSCGHLKNPTIYLFIYLFAHLFIISVSVYRLSWTDLEEKAWD